MSQRFLLSSLAALSVIAAIGFVVKSTLKEQQFTKEPEAGKSINSHSGAPDSGNLTTNGAEQTTAKNHTTKTTHTGNLATKPTERPQVNTTAYHFQYDGNGNVTEVTDASGNPAASYRYDAFGNTLVATGSYAATNKYRFSTKPINNEVTSASLYYYGYRYYDAVTGRWPSRDPIGTSNEDMEQFFNTGHGITFRTITSMKSEELSSGNEYLAIKNSPLMRIDRFGLLCCWTCLTRWEKIAVGHTLYPLVRGHRRFGISVYYAKVKRCTEKQIGSSPCRGTYPPITRVGSLLTVSAKPSSWDIFIDRDRVYGRY